MKLWSDSTSKVLCHLKGNFGSRHNLKWAIRSSSSFAVNSMLRLRGPSRYNARQVWNNNKTLSTHAALRFLQPSRTDLKAICSEVALYYPVNVFAVLENLFLRFSRNYRGCDSVCCWICNIFKTPWKGLDGACQRSIFLNKFSFWRCSEMMSMYEYITTSLCCSHGYRITIFNRSIFKP